MWKLYLNIDLFIMIVQFEIFQEININISPINFHAAYIHLNNDKIKNLKLVEIYIYNI